jgi:hypothetical protein
MPQKSLCGRGSTRSGNSVSSFVARPGNVFPVSAQLDYLPAGIRGLSGAAGGNLRTASTAPVLGHALPWQR